MNKMPNGYRILIIVEINFNDVKLITVKGRIVQDIKILDLSYHAVKVIIDPDQNAEH
jgi:hypothetical protein